MLETQTHRKLNRASAHRGRGDLIARPVTCRRILRTRSRITGERRLWRVEARVVEGVHCVQSELQSEGVSPRFEEIELLMGRHVDYVDARSVQRVSAYSAKGPICGS